MFCVYLVNFYGFFLCKMFGVLNKTHYICTVFNEHT